MKTKFRSIGPFFRIGPDAGQMLQLEKQKWTGDVGNHLLAGMRFSDVPTSLIENVMGNDPGGPNLQAQSCARHVGRD